jgi:hypothetical protein
MKYYLLFMMLLVGCTERSMTASIVPEDVSEPVPVCTDGWTRHDTCPEGSYPGGTFNICNEQISTCIDGQWGPCVQAYQPEVEVCDHLDNDCDGEVDETLTRLCVPQGYENYIYDHDDKDSDCTQGEQTCETGRWSDCVGFQGPQEEECDGRDNNCDGVIDDNPRSLGTCGYRFNGEYRGICALVGESICYDGEILCIGATQPSAAESCNNLDDDCDGLVDEETYLPCDNGCGQGLEVCQMGVWGHCTAPDCSCVPGSTSPCKALPCGQGMMECQEDSTWGSCLDPIPIPEECNNHDDDCNNLIDDDDTPSGYLEQWCYEGEPDTEDMGVCHGALEICSEGYWGDCLGQVTPSPEMCNNLDDDCDGSTDEIREEGKYYDIVIAIDRSVSTEGEILQIITSVENFAALSGAENHWALVIFGQREYNGRPYLSYQLGSVSGFLINLGKVLDIRAGFIEPSLDLIYDVANPVNRFGLAWRDEMDNVASPVLIVFTDEVQQSSRGIDVADILPYLAVCQLLQCNNLPNTFWTNGDPFNDIYLFVSPPNGPWLTLLQYVLDDVYGHIFDIEGAIDIELENLLRTICVVQGE